MFETIQDGRFDDVAANGQQVGTGFLVAGGRATIVVVTDLGKAAATYIALEEAG